MAFREGTHNQHKLVPLADLISREMKNEKLEEPTLRFGCAAQSKKGEDYYLMRMDCERIPRNPSSAFSVFAVFDGHNGTAAAIFTRENLLGHVMRENLLDQFEELFEEGSAMFAERLGADVSTAQSKAGLFARAVCQVDLAPSKGHLGPRAQYPGKGLSSVLIAVTRMTQWKGSVLPELGWLSFLIFLRFSSFFLPSILSIEGRHLFTPHNLFRF